MINEMVGVAISVAGMDNESVAGRSIRLSNALSKD